MNTDLVVSLDYKKPKLITRILIVMLLAFLFILVAAFTFLTVKSKQFVKEFAQAANITQEETLQTASSLLSQLQTDSQNVANLAKKYNFLILGTDKLSGRNNDPELTDTILLLQTDWATGKIKVLTFPRDLYLENYQTKINALIFMVKINIQTIQVNSLKK
jgi:anionic cell wall polymer biosynthesis LytR-Cps2A-Psr (LCP) family protein